jgi:alpha-ketoglutarate-dependent taurine dioxygenase
VYRHIWQKFDLVIRDNRCTLHRARCYGAEVVRDMRWMTVAGDAPTVAMAAE